jgi:hypothetical protein
MEMATENRGPSPASERAAFRRKLSRAGALAMVDQAEDAEGRRLIDEIKRRDERERDRRRAEAQRR